MKLGFQLRSQGGGYPEIVPKDRVTCGRPINKHRAESASVLGPQILLCFRLPSKHRKVLGTSTLLKPPDRSFIAGQI